MPSAPCAALSATRTSTSPRALRGYALLNRRCGLDGAVAVACDDDVHACEGLLAHAASQVAVSHAHHLTATLHLINSGDYLVSSGSQVGCGNLEVGVQLRAILRVMILSSRF